VGKSDSDVVLELPVLVADHEVVLYNKQLHMHVDDLISLISLLEDPIEYVDEPVLVVLVAEIEDVLVDGPLHAVAVWLEHPIVDSSIVGDDVIADA